MNHKKFNYSHGIMFHHFHSQEHYKSQGSISAQDFQDCLDWLSTNYNLLSAEIYVEKHKSNSLNSQDICLTFDDSLKSQFDIAVPLLNKRNLKAFFFVYSAPLLGEVNYLEIFRYYRSVKYKKIDDFYSVFFDRAKKLLQDIYNDAYIKFNSSDHLKHFGFYTDNDRWFRYLRNYILKDELYQNLMLQLMKKDNISLSSCRELLWMTETETKSLHENGHLIGLHSFNHPTMMETLSFNEQQKEYTENFNHLSSIIKTSPISMSHPCGKYNDDTSRILSDLKINIGFRSDMKLIQNKNLYELPRQDHTNIMKFMRS